MKQKLLTLLLALAVIGAASVLMTACSSDDEVVADGNNDEVVDGGDDETPDPHEYVDLGLPSRTLWATTNIGAEKPEDYGLFFAWGETQGYSGAVLDDGLTSVDGHIFDWSTYKWCNGTYNTLTKYNGDSSFGTVDSPTPLIELLPEDDAAYVNWNSNWRMPSKEQFEELIYGGYTTTLWTTRNGVYGRLITSTVEGYKDKSIFLPAAGVRYDGSLVNAIGQTGTYWSRTRFSEFSSAAFNLYFYSEHCDVYIGNIANGRYYGRSVRAVRK